MSENRIPESSQATREVFWQILASIPRGRVSSYGTLARLAGMGRGARLAGRWLGQLPEDTQLPWHRVINSTGRLSLPADSASGQEQFQRLMAEGVIIRNRRVDMKKYAWPD